MRRMDRLISIVKSIELVFDKSKILVIGPRTESDLLNLTGSFPEAKIVGLDLISYSDWVDLGDAHNLKYESESFDVTISGWVITYSSNPKKMIQEMIRVTKNEGIISIGFEHTDSQTLNRTKNLDFKIIDADEIYIKSLSQIKRILEDLNIHYNSIHEYDAFLKNKSIEEKYRITKSHGTQIMFAFQIIKN